ncbi:MAG: hypothetical protein OSA92_02915, partial [Pirellulaceae bacterium]|nr:hypothetical protein [Pirellulaceae bacterium]
VRLHKSVQYARAAHVVQPASKSARNPLQCPLQPSQHVLTGLQRTRIPIIPILVTMPNSTHISIIRGHSILD